MTKDDFIQGFISYYKHDVNVATLVAIIFDYGQGEEDDDPSDMYIKRLVANIDLDWGSCTSRNIHYMIKRAYPYIEFPESLVLV